MKLSIFVTCFNNSVYDINRILHSVYEIAELIKYNNTVELVFVNDNGEYTGAIRPQYLDEIIEVFKTKYPHIETKYIKHEKNRGTLIARQSGVKNCTGDYIIGVDGDDCLIPHSFKFIVDELEKYKPDVCECRCLQKKYSDTELDISDITFDRLVDKYKVKLGYHKSAICLCEFEDVLKHPMTWSKIVKREVYMKAIEMQPEIEHCVIAEDAFSTFTILLNAETFLGLDVPFYYYEINTKSSMTRCMDLDKLIAGDEKYLIAAGYSLPLITPKLYNLTCDILDEYSSKIGLYFSKSLYNVRRQILTRFYNTDRTRIPPEKSKIYKAYIESCENQYGKEVWLNMMISFHEHGNRYFTPNKITDRYGVKDIHDDPICFYEFDFPR